MSTRKRRRRGRPIVRLWCVKEAPLMGKREGERDEGREGGKKREEREGRQGRREGEEKKKGRGGERGRENQMR